MKFFRNVAVFMLLLVRLFGRRMFFFATLSINDPFVPDKLSPLQFFVLSCGRLDKQR